MPKSIAELFDERGSNPRPVQRSHDDVSANVQGQKFQRVEEAIAKDPLELMSPEDAKQVTASSVDMNNVISEIGSMWSGKKTLEKSYDLSKYAKADDIDEDDDNEDEGEENE